MKAKRAKLLMRANGDQRIERAARRTIRIGLYLECHQAHRLGEVALRRRFPRREDYGEPASHREPSVRLASKLRALIAWWRLPSC